MCGRYAASAHPDELVEAYDVEVDATGERSRSVLKSPQEPPPGEPDHNMAPSKQAPVVLTRPPRGEADGIPVRQLRLLTWGLVPSWAKDPSIGARMTNARVETVLEKPAFARAAAAADGDPEVPDDPRRTCRRAPTGSSSRRTRR